MRAARRGIGLCGLLAARAALVPINPSFARVVVGRASRGFASASGAGAEGTGGAGRAWRGTGAALPPPPKSIPATVTFGVVAGEDRGEDPMEPPVVHTDDLFWLRDDQRTDPEVLAHLRGENAHTEAATTHLAGARSRLYAELKGHVQETDHTAPVPHGPYEYYCRTVEGLPYSVWCRRPRSADGSGAAGAAEAGDSSHLPLAGEEVLLDENALAQPHAFFSVGEVEPSPSHQLMAYCTDTSGYETFSIRVLDLETGERGTRADSTDPSECKTLSTRVLDLATGARVVRQPVQATARQASRAWNPALWEKGDGEVGREASTSPHGRWRCFLISHPHPPK
eukprot:scaffold1403_cov103-Isochrysis_galbana.AAC.2